MYFIKLIKQNKILTVILLGSFFVCVAYAFYFRIIPAVDAQAYHNIAINILDGFGFIENRAVSFEYDISIVRAGPGYEYFLAGVYKIFGRNYESVWVIQALVHSLSALLIFLIAKTLFKEYGEKIGLVASTVFSFSPDLIEISAMLMTETLYLFFTCLIIYLFVLIFNRTDDKLLSGITGFVIGISILMRPPILLFVPVFLFLFFRKKQYFSAGLFLLFFVISIAPWVIRNYLVYNQFILTTMIAEYNLWIGNTLLSNGGQISGGFNAVMNYTEQYGFFGFKEKANEEFFSFIFAHPFIFIKLCFLRFIRYFSLIRPMGFWFYQTGIGQLIMVGSSMAWIALLFIAGFSGMVSVLRKKKEIFYYLAVLALTSPLVLISTVVQSRYRFQIYPILAIFGGYFIMNYFYNKGRFKKIVFVVFIFFLLVSLVDSIYFWPTVESRLRNFLAVNAYLV